MLKLQHENGHLAVSSRSLKLNFSGYRSLLAAFDILNSRLLYR